MSFSVKGLAQCLVALLCLLGPGVGQVGALENIQWNWALDNTVGVTPQGGGIEQAVVGWGLDVVGLTGTTSIMKSFVDFKGTIAVNQVVGNANNLATVVQVNQAPPGGSSAPQASYFTNSIIADNVIRNYSSAYSSVIGGGSFSNSRAVMAVTQIAGNMSNVSNVVSFSSGGASKLSLSNASLSDVNASNNVYQNLGVTHASAQIQPDSFNGFKGVGSVIQTAGDMIQVSSHVSVKVNQ